MAIHRTLNFPSRIRIVTSSGTLLTLATLTLFCLSTVFAPHLLAQKSTRSSRKVVSEVKPEYPASLKNLHIEGLVRLKATVLPNGTVSDVDVRGGNPILVENAIKAVKNWKYAPAANQTEEEIVLNFSDR